MSNDEPEWEVRKFAGEIMARVEGDPVARLGVMHAATMLIVDMAIEDRDPAAAIDALVGDIHSEATAMVELILSGAVLASETNVISMESLQ